MTVPGNLSSPLLATAAGAGAAATANITRSLRISAGDSAYLNRTPSSQGNRRTMTISFWYKNTVKSVSQLQQVFIAAQFTSPAKDYYTKFGRLDDGSLLFNSRLGGSDTFKLRTAQLLRDPSAWYHIVLAIDTTEATAANRVKLYINGSQVTDFQDETYPSQNLNIDYLNENQLHFIGRYLDNSYEYFDGYLADFYFIDGSQLDHTSFGAFDSNGVWQAAAYSGTYGTNGFHLLDFANESTIGHDSSGNENDFTANNFNTGGTPAVITGSASPSGKSGFSDSYPGSYALDGSDTSPAHANYSAGDTTTVTVTFNPAITAGSTLTAKIYQYQSYHSMKVNSGSFVTASGSVVNLLSGHGVSAGDSISSITYRTVSPNSAFALGNELYYIKNGGTNIVSTPHENDVLSDVPQNDTTNTDSGAGGEVGGCYCTFNPLTSSGYTLSEGNLKVDSGSGGNRLLGTIGVSSGKYYFEAEFISHTSTNDSSYLVVVNEDGFEAGIRNRSADLQYFTSSGGNLGDYSSFNWVRGDIHGFALDCDNNQLKVYKNNTLTATISLTADKTYFPGYYRDGSNGSFIFNFGARKFAYAAPSGFKCLTSVSLPTPAISDGGDNFDISLWSGTGAAQTVTGLSFSPDMTWVKERDGTSWHRIIDTVRGQQELFPNATNAKSTFSQGLNSFNSDGFTLGTGADANVNTSGNTYVGWSWNAGANSDKTYAVTVVSDSGNKYRFDGGSSSAVTLDLAEGSTYIFDQSDSSNSGHPLRFSTTSDGTHGSGSEYTTGVTATGTPGSAGAKTTIVIPTGTVYSDLTSGGAVAGSYPMSQAFDGSTSTAGVRAVSGGGFVFGGSLGISYSSSIRIHSGASGIGTQQFKLNDGTATDMAENTFVTVASGSGTLNKLEITAGSTGNSNIYLGAVEVDGVILQDKNSTPTLYYYCSSHSGMGGQANTNSTAGSTRVAGEFNSTAYNQSQNWSSNFSSSNGFATSAANAFDGNISTEAYASSNGGVLTMTFSPSLTGEIVMDIPNGGTFKNSSTDAAIGTYSGGIWTYTASSLPGIKIEQTGGRPNPRQVKLDGKILVDSTATPPAIPSIQAVVKANTTAGFSIVKAPITSSGGTIPHGLSGIPELIVVKNIDTGGTNWVVWHPATGSSGYLIWNTTGIKQSSVNIFNGNDANTFAVGSGFASSTPDFICYCWRSIPGFSKVGTYEATTSATGPFVFTGFKPKYLWVKNIDDTQYSSAYNWTIIDTSRYPHNETAGDLNALYINSTADENTYSYGGASTGLAFEIYSNGFRPTSASAEINTGNTYIFYAVAEVPFTSNGGLAR